MKGLSAIMKRGRKTKRRGYGFVIVIVFILVAVLSISLFFKIDTIKVEGNSNVDTESIIGASGIKIGNNLFFLNKYKAARKVLEASPWIEELKIFRRVPGTIVIEVTEAKAVCVIEHKGTYWMMSSSGRLVESAGEKTDDKMPIVIGVTLVDPDEESRDAITLSAADAGKKENMIELLNGLNECEMLADVTEIDIEKVNEIHFSYLGRFNVNFGAITGENRAASVKHRLDALSASIGQLESDAEGTLDVSFSIDSAVHFIPKR